MKSGFVSIIGRPNAGKSTLMNRLLDFPLSIVTPKAQTTRQRIVGILNSPEGQIVFTDTPGIHQARPGGLNEYMVQEAARSMEGGSVIWYLVDPSSAMHHEQAVLQVIARSDLPVFMIFNKIDLVRSPLGVDALEKELLAGLGERKVPARTFRISAQEGGGVPELLECTWSALSEGPLYYPDQEQLTDRPVRFLVAEKVREQLYHQLGDEIPYSSSVEVEEFNEDCSPLLIRASIFVERDSQKGMVIGKGGAKIKQIGIVAREQIETFLDKKTRLELQVKVLRQWTKSMKDLKRLGYRDER